MERGESPPGESVAGLGDLGFLAVDVSFDFVDGWDDVLGEAVGVFSDLDLRALVLFQVYDQTCDAVSGFGQAGQLAECVLLSLGEGEAGHRFGSLGMNIV